MDVPNRLDCGPNVLVSALTSSSLATSLLVPLLDQQHCGEPSFDGEIHLLHQVPF